MSRTIAYYCGGKKCCLELLVALFSLRQHYKGNITVCLGQTSNQYLAPLLASNDVEVISVPNSDKDYSLQDHWSTRWRAMALVDHDQVLHPDCDTTVEHPIDHLFDLINPDREFITSYYGYQDDGKPYWKWNDHLKNYAKIAPVDDLVPLYFAFGLIGWNKGWPWFQEVADNVKYTITDECSMSYTLMRHGRKGCMAKVDPSDFRLSRAYYRLQPKEFYDTKMWHFAGGGGSGYQLWWKKLLEARAVNAFNLADDEYLKFLDPSSYKKWITNTWPSSTYADHRKRDGLPCDP